MNPIKMITTQKQITRSELARKTKIPYVTLTAIHNGLTAKLQNKTLKKLSEYSQIPQDVLAQSYQIWRDSVAQ